MKKHLPLAVLVLAVAFIGNSLRAPRNPAAPDIQGFGRLPVLVNGRIKPLDTVARSSLLQLQGRQTVTTPDKRRLQPIEWLLDVAFRPELADSYQHFEIVHPDVLAIFDLKMQDGQGEKRFALKQLEPKIAELQRQARLADQVEQALRRPFQRAVLQLYGNLVHYQRLRHALVSPGRPDFLGDLLKFQETVKTGVEAVRAKQAGQPHDEAVAKAMTEIGERFVVMAESTNFLVVPPEADNPDLTAWRPAGTALLDTFRTGQVNAAALAYAGFAHAWRNEQAEQFNKLVQLFPPVRLRGAFQLRAAVLHQHGPVRDAVLLRDRLLAALAGDPRAHRVLA
jgi:hypothetical protein